MNARRVLLSMTLLGTRLLSNVNSTPGVDRSAVEAFGEATEAFAEFAGTDGTKASATQTLHQLVDLSGCGVDKSCFTYPAQCTTDCDYIVTWKMNGPDMVDFEMEGSMSNNKDYIAVGLSHDTSMGDDSVMDCVYSGQDTVSIQMSYNYHKVFPVSTNHKNKLIPDPYQGLVQDSLQGTTINDRVTCRLTRLVSVPDDQQNELVFDLDTPYYLLVARGVVINGEKAYHDVTKVVSSEKIDFTETISNVAEFGNPLLKAHGILMIVAWMISASFGILMPRYNKTSWPNKQLFGKPLWFPIHVSLMTTAMFLTVISFIIIFVESGYIIRYYKGYSPDVAHPILGMIVLCLSVINPIMGAFRPHPGTPRRPIFNGFHFSVGVCAHILSGCNILIATYMSKANFPSWAKWVAVSFICWQAVIECALAVYTHSCLKKSNSKISSSDLEFNEKKYDLNTNDRPEASVSNQEPKIIAATPPSGSLVKTFLLALHLLGVISLGIMLSWGIDKGSKS